jgi:hypothetical protein
VWQKGFFFQMRIFLTFEKRSNLSVFLLKAVEKHPKGKSNFENKLTH